MTPAEKLIAQWQAAGLLDADTAARLRAYEAEEARHGGMRWQVMLALGLGSILLVAGIALFVAAHWDAVSPLRRFLLLLVTVAVIHAGAILVRPRFERLSTALHAVGTGAAGAAIFLVAQIFNIQEHWPTGVLVWAICAAAGWWLLRDEFQLTWMLLLVPAWAFCEYGDRTQNFAGTELMLTRAGFLLGISYIVGMLCSGKAIARGILLGIGVAMVAVGIFALQAFDNLWHEYPGQPRMPLGWILSGWLLVVAAPLLAAAASHAKRRLLLVLGCFFLSSIILPHMFHSIAGGIGFYTTTHAEPWLVSYLLVAALAALLAWTGIQERQPSLINFGVLGFGGTVLWFYFSNVLDKLGRSFSLIVMGLLFVAGAWGLEKIRRRMLRSIANSPEPAP